MFSLLTRPPASQYWRVALVLSLALCGRAAPAADTPVPPDQQLLRMEHDGRARPQEVAAQLLPWLQALPVDSRLRIDGLQVLGSLHAMVPDYDAAERIARQLDGLAQQRPRLAEAALAAAGFVRARVLYRTGPLTRADRVMAEAAARLPDDTPPAMRLRLQMVLTDQNETCQKDGLE